MWFDKVDGLTGGALVIVCASLYVCVIHIGLFWNINSKQISSYCPLYKLHFNSFIIFVVQYLQPDFTTYNFSWNVYPNLFTVMMTYILYCMTENILYLVNVGSELKRGVMNVIYDNSDDESADEEYGEVNPNAQRLDQLW